MVTRVKARLGKRSSDILDDDIVAELQQLQLDLEQDAFLPWFLFTRGTWASTTTIGTARVTLPTGYIRPYKEEDVYIIDPDTGDWYLVTRWRYRDALQLIDGSTARARPVHWEFTGGIFYLRPAPDKAYQVNASYYVADDTLSLASSTNDWSTYAPNLLIAGVQQIVAGAYLQNTRLEASAEKEYARQMQRLINATTVREESPRDESKDDLHYYNADED